MSNTEFKLYEPSTNEEIELFSNFYAAFDSEIGQLTAKKQLSKFPKFESVLETHTSMRSYSFHIFKCQNEECRFHKPLSGISAEKFPDRVLVEQKDGSISNVKGSDHLEKFVPSKQEDV